MESAAENNRQQFVGKGENVRQELTGWFQQWAMSGKPHLEQDNAACHGCSSRCYTRVCRIDKWLPFLLLQETESGLLMTLLFNF